MPVTGVVAGAASVAGFNGVRKWMSQAHEAAFGTNDGCMHEAKASQARETAGSDLQYYGYTGFDSSSTKRVDNSIPLSSATIGHILKDPVISSDATMYKFMKENLTEALHLPIGSELKREYIDFIDSRGRVKGDKSSCDNAMQTRAYVLMLAIRVHGEVSAPFTKSDDGREDVRDAIGSLGTAYAGVADAFFDLGLDGDFLSKNDITEEEMKEEFGLNSKMKQKVLGNLLKKYKPQQTKHCSMGCLCVHMTFDFAHVPKYPPPSSEYVRCRMNRLMAYESARQLLGLGDIEAQTVQTNAQAPNEQEPLPAPTHPQNGSANSADDTQWTQA